MNVEVGTESRVVKADQGLSQERPFADLRPFRDTSMFLFCFVLFYVVLIYFFLPCMSRINAMGSVNVFFNVPFPIRINVLVKPINIGESNSRPRDCI